MLIATHPKLPMRDQARTKAYYVEQLGFHLIGEYPDYLLLGRDGVEIHFFSFKELDPSQNYGQIYVRVEDIDQLYQNWQTKGVAIHPNAPIANKPWGQREFALLDPDHNLLTFGASI